MKRITIVFSAAILLMACHSTDHKVNNSTADSLAAIEKAKALTDTANFTTLEWIDSTTKDLGKMNKGEHLEITYRFKNTGNKPLIIESVSAQCGCTIPEKPEKPYAPGEEGIIKAKYNGTGSGTISKQIYVRANTTPSVEHTLTFRGEMQEK